MTADRTSTRIHPSAPLASLFVTLALGGAAPVLAADAEGDEAAIGVKQPAQQIETIDPDATGEGADKLPAVQEDKLPAVQENKLPAVQDKAPAGLKEQVAPKLKEQVTPELKEQAAPKLKEQTTPELRESMPEGERREAISGDGPGVESGLEPIGGGDGVRDTGTGGFAAPDATLEGAVLSRPAVVDSIRPALVGPGDTLTITGSNFRSRTAQRRIRLLHNRREAGSLQAASWREGRVTSRPLPNVMESGRYRVRFEEDGEPYSETSYGEGKEFWFFRPQVTGYEPARAALGGVVDVRIGDKPNINFDRFGIEVWLGKGGRALERVEVLRVSPGKLRVRLPDRVPGARPGGGGSGYWIALYRTAGGRQRLYGNKLADLTLSWPERRSLSSSTDANCLDMAQVTITGGRFEAGTEVSRQRGSWSPGKTHVEIRSDDAEATRLYDQVKHGLEVVDEHEMSLQVPVCFFAAGNTELRVIYPDGSRSDWVPIHAGRR